MNKSMKNWNLIDFLQNVEEMAQKALECPCIADLRSGPCGFQFSEAFLCFLKSTSEEKVCLMFCFIICFILTMSLVFPIVLEFEFLIPERRGRYSTV
jgi:hypothetical protein